MPSSAAFSYVLQLTLTMNPLTHQQMAKIHYLEP